MKNDVEKKHSIFLCCSLYVWKVVHYDESNALNPALQSLLQCISQFHQEEWLDVILAFHILADASCKDKRVLEAFQCLISYDFSPSIPTSSHLCDTCYSSFSSKPNTRFFCKPSNATPSSDDKALQEPEDFDLKKDESNNEKEVINNAHQFSNNKDSTERLEETQAINKLASAQRFQNRRQYRWPWQMVYTFSECLMTICMYGACSDVKKSSLIGSVKRSKNVLGSGLIPLLNYRDDDDSWKVRYGVVKSLVRVCRYHGSDVSKDGLSNVAWLAVIENENTENDARVLEAVKLARVEAEFEKRLNEDHVRSSLWATRMASALLPMLHYKFIDSPATVANPECTAALKSKDKGPIKKLHKSRVVLPNTHNRSDVDTTLRQEINLNHLRMKPRVDYISRQNNDLRGIIDDQWKKELLQELEDEMKESIEQLEKKRNDEFQNKIKL
ncbi:transmembrane protein 232-like isoform X2 [Xenia sp. Carnegie-2017]|uniref:transmembrane protein 232-like isoform X2 n=1 Tax=Xenia sp. Carnegie-2017 TaxID=2897299 RepID=UPI001F04ADCA|nr:transmembrane protein 232-like isoform X2 [Xenia sp. Carnegie-2017]